MPLLYHAYVYLEFLILACTIYILAPKIRKAVCCQGYNNFEKSAVKLEKLNGIETGGLTQ